MIPVRNEYSSRFLIVPTLRVVKQRVTLRVTGTRSVLSGIPTRSLGTIMRIHLCHLIVPTLRVVKQRVTLRVTGTQSVLSGIPTRSVGTIMRKNLSAI
jgi:alkylated DNA nucleotide flippase Atl1